MKKLITFTDGAEWALKTLQDYYTKDLGINVSQSDAVCIGLVTLAGYLKDKEEIGEEAVLIV